MRLLAIVLFFSALVAATLAAPAVERDGEVEEKLVVDAEPTTQSTILDILSSKEVEDEENATALPAEDATTLPSTRDGRQIDDEASNEDDPEDDDDDDDEEEEDEEEEEEEAARNQAVKGTSKKSPSKNKHKTAEKPIPVLGEGGVEDDEAEDLGLFEREEPKSDEKASDEKESQEDEKEEQEDEEEESNEDEERDEPSGPTGLIAEPASSERGDVDDSPPPAPAQNEVEQPLAIAVVQREDENEPSVPVVPVIVEEGNDPPSAASEVAESKAEPSRKNKPKKEKDEDEDEDDDEDEEEEEEEEEEAARSEKVSRSQTEDVLYYYPIPANPVVQAPDEEFF